MNQIYEPQWRDENTLRAYPFEFTASLLSSDGALQLNPCWLVDAALYPSDGVGLYEIGTITIDQNTVHITIIDSVGTIVGEGTAKRSNTQPILILSGDTHVATLVPGEDANHSLFAAGDGVFNFAQGAATFVASTVLPLAQFSGFFGFQVGTEVLQSSNLTLVAENGIQITASEEIEQQSGQSQINVIQLQVHALGDPQYLSRRCDDVTRRPLRFIREVVFQYNDFTHSCRPNSSGNILFLAGSPSSSESALQVRPSENSIIIRMAGKSI